jgi:TolB protein
MSRRFTRRLAGAALLFVAAACGDSGTEPKPQPAALEPLLAFAYEPPVGRTKIGVMSHDGSGLRWVTDGSAHAEMPAWSPDGMTLALSYQGVPNRNPQLYTVSVAGGTPAAVPIGDLSGRAPSWSPDGRSIAFDDFHELWIVGRDGGGLRQLAPHEGESGVPSWSPDGQWVAFTSMRNDHGDDDASRKLYVVRADGTGLRRLAAEVPSAIVYHAWSPDGKRIVFDTNGGYDLWIVTVATGVVTRLTSTPEIEKHPAWSPDGERIAFVRRIIANDTHSEHIFSMRVDGTDVRQLTTGEGWYAWPRYRPARAG